MVMGWGGPIKDPTMDPVVGEGLLSLQEGMTFVPRLEFNQPSYFALNI